jgi:uncharacterized protein (TIGR02246 family)
MRQTIFAVLFLIFCATLATVTAASAEFRPAVESGGKEFMAAFDAKDSARVGSLYAMDAIAFPPNSEMVKGRDAIQTFWKGIMDAGMKATVEVVETESEGNLGVEVGKYTILDASGKTVDEGKYVVVWKNEGGWKLYRDIWNTNMPTATAPAK